MFLLFYFKTHSNHVSCLQIFGLISVIHSYSGHKGDNLSSYRNLMQIGVRMATWNQILDPWVYILLRRTVLRKIYLIVKCQVGLKGSKLGRWDRTSFHSSEKNEINKVCAEIRSLNSPRTQSEDETHKEACRRKALSGCDSGANPVGLPV